MSYLASIDRLSSSTSSLLVTLEKDLAQFCSNMAYASAAKEALSVARVAASLAEPSRSKLTLVYLNKAIAEFNGVRLGYASFVTSPSSALTSANLLIRFRPKTISVCLAFSPPYAVRVVTC